MHTEKKMRTSYKLHVIIATIQLACPTNAMYIVQKHTILHTKTKQDYRVYCPVKRCSLIMNENTDHRIKPYRNNGVKFQVTIVYNNESILLNE